MTLADDIAELEPLCAEQWNGFAVPMPEADAIRRILAIVTPLAGLSAEQAAYLIDHQEGLADSFAKEHQYKRNAGLRPKSPAERASEVFEWEMRSVSFRALAEALKAVTT